MKNEVFTTPYFDRSEESVVTKKALIEIIKEAFE